MSVQRVDLFKREKGLCFIHILKLISIPLEQKHHAQVYPSKLKCVLYTSFRNLAACLNEH